MIIFSSSAHDVVNELMDKLVNKNKLLNKMLENSEGKKIYKYKMSVRKMLEKILLASSKSFRGKCVRLQGRGLSSRI